MFFLFVCYWKLICVYILAVITARNNLTHNQLLWSHTYNSRASRQHSVSRYTSVSNQHSEHGVCICQEGPIERNADENFVSDANTPLSLRLQLNNILFQHRFFGSVTNCDSLNKQHWFLYSLGEQSGCVVVSCVGLCGAGYADLHEGGGFVRTWGTCPEGADMYHEVICDHWGAVWPTTSPFFNFYAFFKFKWWVV